MRACFCLRVGLWGCPAFLAWAIIIIINDNDNIHMFTINIDSMNSIIIVILLESGFPNGLQLHRGAVIDARHGKQAYRGASDNKKNIGKLNRNKQHIRPKRKRYKKAHTRSSEAAPLGAKKL